MARHRWRRLTPEAIPTRGRHLPLVVLLVLSGCDRVPTGRGAFTVATTWPGAERKELARGFARWLEGRNEEPIGIAWVSLRPGDDLTRIALPERKPHDWRPRPIDVLLGGPATGYVRLARLGRLVPVERPGHPEWCVARQSTIARPGTREEETLKGPAIFDDPRRDPVALERARHELGRPRPASREAWASGYAALVRSGLPPPQSLPDENGEAAWSEGVAIVAGGAHPGSAQRFCKFLAERARAEPPSQGPGDLELDADALLADLLGATLVDAGDELREARQALDQARNRDQPERWMTHAPPWPPASVDRLRARDRSGALVEALARQVAPDADVRAWLVRSWLAPARRIDDKLLSELSGAVGGKLAREPRFRAWLRGEWTAWARQRYRRVARLAAAGGDWP